MNAAVIKVKFADPAKPGKKQATIKAEDGTVFGVWPDKFGLLRPGQTYRVEFSERDYNGKVYRTITKCEPAAAVEETATERGTSPNTAEHDFVTRMLAASIQANAVETTENSLLQAVRVLRGVYKKSML